MGLDIHGTRFLLYARLLGVDYARTLMIGRQGLNLSRAQLRANLARLGFPAGAGAVDTIFDADGGYAAELLRFLGAHDVQSLDNSDYEGATHLADLNREVAESFKGRYSVVLDGGSLEHIFNFPVALRNCLEMVAVGGHFLAITPANNFMGHGFYQFSPELFLSVFTAANGFHLERLIAFEDRPRAVWYRIPRPASANKRIMSRHSRPVYLLVVARRTEAVPPLREMPQQSDYIPMWARETRPAAAGPASRRPALLRAALRLTPEPVKRSAKAVFGYRRRFDPRFFRKLDWREELRRLRPPGDRAAAGPAAGGGSELGEGE